MTLKIEQTVSCVSDIDDCVGVSCSNDVACADEVNSYTCNCASGFTGQHCETGLL